MRALTLDEPWASLIRYRVKKIETRSWKTNYRGPLLIHAGAQKLQRLERLYGYKVMSDMLALLHQAGGKIMPGCALCVANLKDCLPMGCIHPNLLTATEVSCGNFNAGRWGWILEDVKPLHEPIRMKGAQGLWNVQPAVVACINLGLVPWTLA